MQVQLDRDEENLYLFLLQLVLLLYPGEDLRHVGLQHHSAHDQLVEDEVDLVHVEDEVELAHVLEALVQRLHEHLDEVEDAQLGLGAVHAEDEVEGGVVPVDELVVGSSNQAGRERRKMYFFQRNGIWEDGSFLTFPLPGSCRRGPPAWTPAGRSPSRSAAARPRSKEIHRF